MRLFAMTCVAAACAGGCLDADPELATRASELSVCGNNVFEPGELCVDPPAPLIATGAPVSTVITADLDGNGWPDVIAATPSAIWYRYGGPGGFGATFWVSTPGASYTDVAAGDFDADGDLDVAATNVSGSELVAWRNPGGQAAFSLWARIGVGGAPTRVLAQRLNADARTDLVVLTTNTEVVVLRASAAPWFGPFAPKNVYTIDTHDIALADCDLDGTIDLIATPPSAGPSSHQVHAFRNNGTGVFGLPVTSPLPMNDSVLGALEPFAIAAGKFDANNRFDLAITASHSRLVSLFGLPNCQFLMNYTPASMDTTWAWTLDRLRSADLDNDGHADLLAPHGVVGGAGDQFYSLMFGDGTAHFPTRHVEQFAPAEALPRDFAVLDADGDGIRDILIASDTGVVFQHRTP